MRTTRHDTHVDVAAHLASRIYDRVHVASEGIILAGAAGICRQEARRYIAAGAAARDRVVCDLTRVRGSTDVAADTVPAVHARTAGGGQVREAIARRTWNGRATGALEDGAAAGRQRAV